MSHNRNIENSGAKIYLNSGGLILGFSKQKNFIMLPKDHSCDFFGDENGCLFPLYEA